MTVFDFFQYDKRWLHPGSTTRPNRQTGRQFPAGPNVIFDDRQRAQACSTAAVCADSRVASRSERLFHGLNGGLIPLDGQIIPTLLPDKNVAIAVWQPVASMETRHLTNVEQVPTIQGMAVISLDFQRFSLTEHQFVGGGVGADHVDSR